MNINVATMNIDGREFLVADVTGGLGFIGVTPVNDIKTTAVQGKQPAMDILFAGGHAPNFNMRKNGKREEKQPVQPLISMIAQSRQAKFSNKLIAHHGSIDTVGTDIRQRLAGASENYFVHRQSLQKAVLPVLESLTDGLYLIHESKMIPTDGQGNFFWLAYQQRHEISGTSEYNSVIGRNGNYEPCFLIPTVGASACSIERLKDANEHIHTGKRAGGVAYHASGLFSALLDGHHLATASLINGADFYCIVIEPVREAIYDGDQAGDDNGKNNGNPKDGAAKIIALSCPYANLPLDSLPDSMIENYLMRRRWLKHEHYTEIKAQLSISQRLVSRRGFPQELFDNCELLPDVAMYESASAVSEISEEQLHALLAGETKYQGKLIVSGNYYNSIVTVCNYLQYKNFDRFISFVLDILKNRDLTATHKYISERLLYVMHPDIYSFFKEVMNNERAANTDISATATKYVKQYETTMTERENAKRRERENKDALMSQTKRSLDNPSGSTLEKMRMASKMQSGGNK